MDELLDILDAEGNRTGQSALKSDAHKNGWFHPTVHIWFYTSSGMVLLQQRAKLKDTHPLLWDVSVAGHIASGESYTTAAVREVQEEIGLKITPQALEKIGVFKSEHHHSKTLIDREYNHTYLCKLETPLEQLTRQESEVEALALVPLIQFAEEIWGLANTFKYVPHEATYYKAVITAIKERL